MLGKDLLQPAVQKVQLGIGLKSLGIPIRIMVGKDMNGRGVIGNKMSTDHLPEPNVDRHLTKVRRARKVTTLRANANAAATEVLVQHFIFSLT